MKLRRGELSKDKNSWEKNICVWQLFPKLKKKKKNTTWEQENHSDPSMLSCLMRISESKIRLEWVPAVW